MKRDENIPSPPHELLFLFRHRLRQFFEGSIEQTRCHDQARNHFRIAAVVDHAAQIRLQYTNFLDEFGETC